MAAFEEFLSLMRWKDSTGWHEQGEVVSLPYESHTDRMDANRLIDYGVITKVSRRRRRKGTS